MNKTNSSHLISGPDLLAMKDPPIFDGQAWGPWTFNAKNLTLHRHGCEIDLERMTSSAEILNCIFQFTKKGWCTREDAGHLLDALNDLLKPQRNVCGMGRDRPFNPTLYLKSALQQE